MDTSAMRMYKEKANGRMSSDPDDEIITGVVQNLLRHVTSGERAAGYFDYYGTWWLVEDDDDGVGIDPEIYQDFPTLSDDDYVMLFVMSDRVAVSDITGYATGTDTEEKYGCLYLKEDITAGDLTFEVEAKNAALLSGNDAVVADGKTIKITNKSIDTSATGAEETHTLDGAAVVSSDGLSATLTIADSDGFANSYTANGTTRVRSIIEPSTLQTSVTTPVVTSTAGTFDHSTTGNLVLDNIGTVDEDWTLYFTDATHFRLDGDSLGTGVSTGDIATTFAPNHANKSKPYFTIAPAAFGGTFAPGDTITFTTKPSATHVGVKRVVPAGSSSLANNKTSQVLVLEAAGS